MKIARDDSIEIFEFLKTAVDPNQIMMMYDQDLYEDPIMKDLCLDVKRTFPEMFPALGLMYAAITGNFMGMRTMKVEGVTTHYPSSIFIPHKFLSWIIMDSYYADMNMGGRWHDDRDYSRQSDWSRITTLDKTDRRIIDPSRQFGFYTNCRYYTDRGTQFYGLMLNMNGGEEANSEKILTDLCYLVDAFYADELMAQDIKRMLTNKLPGWLEKAVEGGDLFKVYPELQRYQRYIEGE